MDFAHPLLEVTSRSHSRRVLPNDVLKVMSADCAWIHPGQALDQVFDVLLLPLAGVLRIHCSHGVQQRPGGPPQHRVRHGAPLVASQPSPLGRHHRVVRRQHAGAEVPEAVGEPSGWRRPEVAHGSFHRSFRMAAAAASYKLTFQVIKIDKLHSKIYCKLNYIKPVNLINVSSKWCLQ